MKVLKPFYYDDFQCIGGKCKDTCCGVWDISIDKKSFIKYRKVKGEFGKRLNEGIARIRKGESENEYGMMKLKNRRCSLLNDKITVIYI